MFCELDEFVESRSDLRCHLRCCCLVGPLRLHVRRLSLPKGEDRVRVCSFKWCAASEPLTSILSPFSKGRGGQTPKHVVRQFIYETLCVALRQFPPGELKIARGFFCHRGLAQTRGGT